MWNLLNYKYSKWKEICGIVEDNHNLYYFRNYQDIIKKYKTSSRSTLGKYKHATKENPYIIYKTNLKFFFSNEFIPIEKDAVPIEESLGLLQTNIGKSCDANTEIN